MPLKLLMAKGFRLLQQALTKQQLNLCKRENLGLPVTIYLDLLIIFGNNSQITLTPEEKVKALLNRYSFQK